MRSCKETVTIVKIQLKPLSDSRCMTNIYVDDWIPGNKSLKNLCTDYGGCKHRPLMYKSIRLMI